VNLSIGTITYLVADTLGSVRGAVTSTGTLSGTTAYDAWGNPQGTGGLAATNAIRVRGCYTDATGLLYLDHRYYDPQTGQFISVDPDVSQTSQPYAYADGDPVSITDLNGLQAYVDGDRFHVLNKWNDVDGNQNIPLRQGWADDSGAHPEGFGYNHYACKHDILRIGTVRMAIERGEGKA
jgi:RHS repeat-associated protein